MEDGSAQRQELSYSEEQTVCEEVKFPENDSGSSRPPSWRPTVQFKAVPSHFSNIIFVNYNLLGPNKLVTRGVQEGLYTHRYPKLHL